MRRRVSVLPLLLLLAAMASPALGSSRSVESLRVVVTIAWLHDQDAPQSAPVDQTPRRLSGAASPSLVLRALDSRARSTALLRARFQRPPPRLLAL
jgi:hypothetical protein